MDERPSDGTEGVDDAGTDASSEGETPPPSVSEMIGRRVTVRYGGGDRRATVVDGSYARTSGDVVIAVELDAVGDEAESTAAGERIVVGEERVTFD